MHCHEEEDFTRRCEEGKEVCTEGSKEECRVHEGCKEGYMEEWRVHGRSSGNVKRLNSMQMATLSNQPAAQQLNVV